MLDAAEVEHALPYGQRAEHYDWFAALARLEGAYSGHTLRAYRADFGKFDAWCTLYGRVALPATPETVAEFLFADAATSASATLKRRLCGIRKVHRLFRLASPVEDEEVATALRRALRTKRRQPNQALGLTAELRDRLIGACPNTLLGTRHRAMLAVGYDTLCRRSELVALRVEDLEWRPNGGAKILVRRAKNDPFGDGRLAHITPAAADHVRKWLESSGLELGPLFPPVEGGLVQSRQLDPVAVNRTLKVLARAARLQPSVTAALSGHSMRVGAAQDLMVMGRDLLQIMAAGGWTSINVVSRYVKEAEASPW